MVPRAWPRAYWMGQRRQPSGEPVDVFCFGLRLEMTAEKHWLRTRQR